MAMDDGTANDMVGTSPYVLYTRERACLGSHGSAHPSTIHGRAMMSRAPQPPSNLTEMDWIHGLAWMIAAFIFWPTLAMILRPRACARRERDRAINGFRGPDD